MIGKTVSHYKILEELGRGGMGVVYKAVDLDLERTVAIKFLPPDIKEDERARKRFIQEAKAASALEHRNIGTIYEISCIDDGRTFIVMAYYEGETLRERIDRGEMKLEEALDLATQIADGLARAHAKGIVHRDIKPSNIIITKDNEAKIIDFGIAKLSGKTTLTSAGSTLGTPAYMSPEQARGEKLDHRSDIFSLGSILYEMLAGEPPFRGEYEAGLLYCIVNEEPIPLSKVRDDLPPGLPRIVEHALEKRTEDRYQSAEQISRDLRQLSADGRYSPYEDTGRDTSSKVWRRGIVVLAAAIVIVSAVVLLKILPDREDMTEVRRTIAVLPFENIGSSEDEYFADGLTEEIIARLAGIKNIGVIARTSVLAYKNTEKSIREIGRELGVDHILEGTVRWSKKPDGSSEVRITPQLIKVADETHVWAEIYNEPLEDIFDVQSNIAMAILSNLDVALGRRDKEALAGHPTENLEAYDYFLRGIDYYNRGSSVKTTTRAIESFAKAVELDSTYAKAHAWLSMAYSFHAWHNGGYEAEGLNKNQVMEHAKHEAETALRLDPRLADAYLAYSSYIFKYSMDNELALQYALSANELQPNNPEILIMLGYRMRSLGRFDESVRYIKKAVELDPLSRLKLFSLLNTYTFLRRFEQAKEIYKRICLLNPDDDCLHSRELIIKMHLRDEPEEYVRKLKEAIVKNNPIGLFEYWMYWDHAAVRIYYDEYEENAIENANINDFGYLRSRYYYFKAYNYERKDNLEMRDVYYDSLISYLRENKNPENYIADLHLGIAYAKRGMRKKAVEVAERWEKEWPLERDTQFSPERLLVSAIIYTAAGEQERALDIIDTLLGVPSYLTVYLLEHDPAWDPLRDNPMYKRIVEKYGAVEE